MSGRPSTLEGPAAAELFAACAPIAAPFAAAGRRLYLVGGSVRDLIAGRPIDEPDLDFTTDAHPSETKRLLGPVADALWTQGERFGTIAAHVGGRLVEVTTHRAEAYEPDSRKPVVRYSDDVRVDLGRRDFTINALAIEVTTPTPELIDPFDGVGDLRRGRLATPLTPTESFSDDPLRMMRAARFLARFSLTPDPELVDAVRAMAGRLSVVSVERIRDEFHKLLVLDDPRPGLAFLVENGLAERFLPELTGEVVERVGFGDLPADGSVRLAAILACAPGRERVERRLRELRSSRQQLAWIGGVVAVVEAIADHGGNWTDGDVRRLVHRRLDLVDDAVDVARAVGHVVAANGFAEAFERVSTREDLSRMTVPIGGRDVMEILGAGSGPLIGEAMNALVAHRLEVGPLTRDDAIGFVRDWGARR